MKKILAVVIVFVLALPGFAFATPYTPTLNDIASWGLLQSTTGSFLNPVEDLRPDGFDGIKFTGNIVGAAAPAQSSGYVAIGTSVALDLAAYSSFDLKIFNENENPWHYSLFLWDGLNYALSSVPLASITNGNSGVLSLDLLTSGLDLASIDAIGFVIEQTVPILVAGKPADRTYETVVAPVPEPGTMVLLGAGLLGLAIFGKRRMNA